MSPSLARLVLGTTALGGCSLLYDPKDLPLTADAPVNVDPCVPQIEDVSPPVIVEGSGAQGSRPALIVLRGKNFGDQNVRVAIKAAPSTSKTPMIMVDDAKLEVEIYGQRLAVPVTLPVDETLAADETIPLEVTITQDCATGSGTSSAVEKLTLRGLGELTTATLPADGFPAGLNEFSKIEVATGTIKARANSTDPLRLRSRSSVSIANAVMVTANANGQDGGPGGGKGGGGGAALNAPGAPGQGPTPGAPSGMAGGFTSADPQLTTLGNPNRGSGGSGGIGGTLVAGGLGGGGGGTIEISAAGSLTVGSISARGANGTSTEGGPNDDGGAGSGGVILLRAGGDLTAQTFDVSGGTNRGAGAPGRVRFDAGGTVTMPVCSACYRGPMFVDPPLITRQAKPEFTLAGKAASDIRYIVISDTGDVTEPVNTAIGAGGMARVTLRNELNRGWNQVCVLVENAPATSDTRNCIEVAYLAQ